MELLLVIFFLLALLARQTWVWGLVLLGVIWLFLKPLFWLLAIVALGFIAFLLWSMIAGRNDPISERAEYYKNNPRPTTYRPPDTSTQLKAKRTGGRPRFYRPVRHFRYTKHARICAGLNNLERWAAPKQPSHKPKVGDTKTENGKTYRFSESRRWKRVK